MIKGIGIDIEDIGRFRNLDKSSFVDKIFTDNEKNYCLKKSDPAASFCGKFCAKEAILKAIGLNLDMKDIEIKNNLEGKPEVWIKNNIREDIFISITHNKDSAAAVAIYTP